MALTEYILLPTIVSSNLSITHKIPNDTQWINILPHTILLLWRQLRLLLFICKMASTADSCSEFSKKPRTKDSFVPFLFCFVPAIFLSLSFANTENSEEKNFCISLGFFSFSLSLLLYLFSVYISIHSFYFLFIHSDGKICTRWGIKRSQHNSTLALGWKAWPIDKHKYTVFI